MIIHNYEYVVTCNKGILINNKGTTDIKTTTSINTSLRSSSQGMTPAHRQDTTITKDYTDIQPKISIDEISLLWLFCGC